MDKTHELYMDVQYGTLQKGPLETGCKQSSAPSGSMLKFLKSCVKCICKFCPTNRRTCWSGRHLYNIEIEWVFGHNQAVTYV